MKFIKDALKFFRRDEPSVSEYSDLLAGHAESERIIEEIIYDRNLFEIGRPPCVEKPVFATEYIGGFVGADNGLLTLGVCTAHGSDLIYKDHQEIIVAYPEDNELFLVPAKIESMRRTREDEHAALAAIRDSLEFQDKIKNHVRDTRKLDFIMANLWVLAEPYRHQRRYHFRVAANWIIHFKIVKPCIALSSAQKRWIAEKIVDRGSELLKTDTVDVSTGGFKSISSEYLPAGIYIECIIEINGARIAQSNGAIIGKVLDCSPSREKSELFDVRVQFTEMPVSAGQIVKEKIMLELAKSES